MVNSRLKILFEIVLYAAMFALICIFFTGNGEFIYEAF